jgi:hypothetical protein
MVDCPFLFQGNTLKETEGSWDLLYMQMSLQGCRGSGCSLSHSVLSKVFISGTVGSNEKVAPNKAISNLDWWTGIV